MRDCERLRALVGLSGAGFAGFYGFSGWRGPADTGALVRTFDERLRAFTRDSDRSSEGTGRAAGDFSVGLPTKAGQRGYFYEFFHNNVRYVRSKAYFAFDLGCFRSIFHVVDRFAQRGQAARLTLVGPRRARSFTKKTALPDAGRLSDVGWAGRSGLARHETRGPTSY
jgi:hypothetical protein